MGNYKKYLYFFFIILSFFILKIDTYALWTANTPTYAQTWEGSEFQNYIGSSSFVARYVESVAMHSFSTDKTISRVQFGYNGIPTSWKSSYYYDVSFIISMPNVASGYNGIPIVTFNGYTCNVKPAISVVDWAATSLTTWSNLFGVVCENVNVYGAFQVNAYTGSTSPEFTLNPAYYGISQEWSYSQHGSVETDILLQQQINKIDQTNSKLDSVNSNLNANKQAIDSNTNAVNEQTDTLKDSNSSEATDSAGSFFSGFTTDTFGLTSIITAPLNLITSITSSTCSPVGLPIPFVDNMTLELPCLRGIYEQHFGTLLNIYQTITFGIVAYWVCVRIFALVKDFKNPEHDEIEVVDL